ncbi:WG repeat-containing protein [Flavobacterium pedocola]
MKQILYLSFFILLSCSSGKPQKEMFVSAKEAIDSRFLTDVSLKPYHYQTDKHKFQTNNLEVVYDVQNGVWGLRNNANNQILRTDYTYLAFLDEQYLIAEKNSLTGIIDTKGTIIIPLNYDNISCYTIDKPFFLVQKNGIQALFDANGQEKHPFSIRYVKSEVTYKNKIFLLIEDNNQTVKMLKINDGKVAVLPFIYSFEQLKSNLAMVAYTVNGYYGVYNMENDERLDNYASCYYHKPRNEIWAKSKKAGYKNYDVVIDSNFVERPNTHENVVKIENDNFFIATENGMQIMDLKGKIAPFTYPKIESYNNQTNQYSFIYGKDYSDYQKRIFKFYTNRDSKKYGIIDLDGNIIVDAEKFDYVTYSDLNNLNSYNKNLSAYKQHYLRENKLDKLFYATNYYADKSSQVTIFKANGTELISITIEKEDNCYLELSQFSNHGHLMAKCGEKMKLYDLNTKKSVFEIKELRSYENFKERYPNGYYYFSYDEPKHIKIKYLSNNLKLLYDQKVVSDSVWYKMIKGDKVYFKKNNKIGLIDFDEKEIVPAGYDTIAIIHPDFNIVAIDKKYGVISNNNKTIIELIYDKIIYNISNQSFDCYLNDKKEIKYLNQIKLN